MTRSTPHTIAIVLAAAALAALTPLATHDLRAQDVTLEQLDAIEGRHIGPVGNRVVAASGVPGDPQVYYVGAAAGGIWKTTDAGIHWEPIFDDQDVAAVGALAVAPSDPGIVWAGTGEPFIRSNVSEGDGVYKSVDGGESWRHMGLEATGRIARIRVHPYDPDVVYVAALGHTHAPQDERGVYRTTDGGETWELVLHTNEHSGASDLAMDPNNPRILYAGMWRISVKTWNRTSGGPGSGLYRSMDGGDTWERMEGPGLPEDPVGKVAVCMTKADSERVYALIETGDGVPEAYAHIPGGEEMARREEVPNGELWRSDDGGESWRMVNHDQDLGGRQAYYSRCAVNPDDPDEVYFLAADYSVSKDGGVTSTNMQGDRSPTWDTHHMWIDPTDGDRQIVVGDGGIAITENRGLSWHKQQIPVAQLYHVTADNAVPYNVLGNRQDGPSTRGPSRSRMGGFFASGIPRSLWHSVGGGESGFATPDPENPNIIWSSASGSGAGGGIVVRYNEETRQYREVEVWPEDTGGWPAGGLRYRFQWTFPIEISPHDNETVYVTSQHVHRTTDGGQSWEVISPDLSTGDTTKMGLSGALTPDNIGVEYCCVIYAFDESPAQQGVFYAGTNDGLVHVSRDDGETWTDVTDNLPGFPADGVVRNIDASKWSAGKAYLTVEAHQVGDFEPYVYRTEDFGESWTRITNGIHDDVTNYTRWVHEDPEREGLLYLGTENKLYVSFDDGANWQSFMTNLPPAPYYGLIVQDHFDDLVIGTYGRGFWIMDDISPLQQLTPEVAASDAHLFEPRQAYRFHSITSPMTMFQDQSDGEDPPYGASLNYWLGSEPEGEVTVRVRNPAGEVIREMEGTKEDGLNRVWWDLREEPSKEVRMRTKPLYGEWVDLGDDGWESVGARFSILAPPGTYTVELEVDGETMTRPLEVIKDPHSEGSMADIEAQDAMLRELKASLERGADMFNRMEWVRKQIDDLQELLTDETGTIEVADAEMLLEESRALDERLVDVEMRLYQLRLTGTGQDGVRWPTKLLRRIEYLAGSVSTADFPPTDQAREVQRVLEERLRDVESEYESLMEGPVADFDRMLRQRDLTPLVSDGE